MITQNTAGGQEENKTYMFQYAYDGFLGIEIVEDTGLITRQEAENLWSKYYDDFIYRYKNGEKPQMAIWKNCSTETDYRETLKELDYRDRLEIKNGIVYKLNEEKIT